MDVSKVNPYIRVAMQSVLPANTTINRRVIFDYELIYIERGSFTLTYADKAYACKTGDVLLLLPGVPHSFEMGDAELYQPHIHFDITYRQNSAEIPVSFKDAPQMTERELTFIHENYFPEPKTPFVSGLDGECFRALFYGIISPNASPLTKKGLLTQLIAYIVENCMGGAYEGEREKPVCERIKAFIDAGQGYGMTLDEFAKMFSFSRAFKLRFGHAPTKA